MEQDELSELMKELSEPIDFHKLVESGALIQKGKSYYMGNKDLLPASVNRKIKSVAQTKNGLKLTFSKQR